MSRKVRCRTGRDCLSCETSAWSAKVSCGQRLRSGPWINRFGNRIAYRQFSKGICRVDVAHSRLHVLPADIRHQRFDIPAICRCPGGEAATQRVAGVQIARYTRAIKNSSQQWNQAVGVEAVFSQMPPTIELSEDWAPHNAGDGDPVDGRSCRDAGDRLCCAAGKR